jgi:hypothetical protein
MSVIFAFSDAVWNVIGIAVNGVILLVLAYLKNKIGKVADEVREVHRSTNSMKDELIAEVRKSEYAAGAKSEADKQTTT